ncbi:MAG: hypothetical protein JO257_01465 [Deltaproteobacteria bacterium]|nr:hypothetical protein [Deltaproteobacteria bacterium]
MNVEVREHLGSAQSALRAGEHARARAKFVEAGDLAASVQLWRTSVRCYRHALEIDLLDRLALARVIGLLGRGGHVVEWSEYARAVDRHDWPHFGCLGAQIVIGDDGAVVECAGAGPVLEVAMPEADLVTAQPDGRFVGMPIAMAMIIVRRALGPGVVRVAFAGRAPVVLDENGDWSQRGSAGPTTG